MRGSWITWGVLGLAVALAGCAGELPGPDRHGGMRAAAGPGEAVSSPENEVMGPPQGVVPLVRVETSNKKDEPAKVTTIWDGVKRAETRPATRPSEQAAPRGSGETTGSGQ